jgi:hypothetical protein
VLWIHKFDANEVATVGMKIVSPLGTALQRLWDGDLKRWRVHTSSQAMARSHTPPPASAPTRSGIGEKVDGLGRGSG